MAMGDALKKLEDGLQRLLEPSSPSTVARGNAVVLPPLNPPLLIRKALLERIRREQIRIEGEAVFPFSLIEITLYAPDEKREAHLGAEMIVDERFKTELLRMFASQRVTYPKDLHVLIVLESKAERFELESLQEGYYVRLSRESPTEKVVRKQSAQARLVVETGTAAPMVLSLERSRTYLGRLKEVSDRSGRIIRRNDLAFDADEPANATVSRAHAHIRFDTAKDEYRIFDDMSRDGTLLVRDGRRIPIPPGASRGALLQEGDEIYLGQVRLRFER